MVHARTYARTHLETFAQPTNQPTHRPRSQSLVRDPDRTMDQVRKFIGINRAPPPTTEGSTVGASSLAGLSTNSIHQVQGTIHNGSVGRWKRYFADVSEHQIGELVNFEDDKPAGAVMMKDGEPLYCRQDEVDGESTTTCRPFGQ